jgi:hypothetical protein
VDSGTPSGLSDECRRNCWKGQTKKIFNTQISCSEDWLSDLSFESVPSHLDDPPSASVTDSCCRYSTRVLAGRTSRTGPHQPHIRQFLFSTRIRMSFWQQWTPWSSVALQRPASSALSHHPRIHIPKPSGPDRKAGRIHLEDCFPWPIAKPCWVGWQFLPEKRSGERLHRSESYCRSQSCPLGNEISKASLRL